MNTQVFKQGVRTARAMAVVIACAGSCAWAAGASPNVTGEWPGHASTGAGRYAAPGKSRAGAEASGSPDVAGQAAGTHRTARPALEFNPRGLRPGK
jgi:hypothetical protein